MINAFTVHQDLDENRMKMSSKEKSLRTAVSNFADSECSHDNLAALQLYI